MTAPVFTVVGTPGDRRVQLFADACRAAGLDAPRVIPWRDVLTGTSGDRRTAPGASTRGGELAGAGRTDASGHAETGERMVTGSSVWTGSMVLAGGLTERGRPTVAGALVRGGELGGAGRTGASGRAETRGARGDDPADLGVLAGRGGLAGRACSTGENAWFAPGLLVRIESPGEDPEADALLRGPGDPTRVGGGARWYAAFMTGVRHVAASAERAGARLLNDPGDIAVMFDKRLCHARLEAAGVPVPPALQAVRSYAELRRRMGERGWRRVFVKPAHGSSASGVVALQVAGTRIKAVTSAAAGPEGYHNSLRVRSYETEREVAALVDALAPDGLHVERWVPKVSPGGRALDLRVVVVAGVATHAVVRTSRWPMTNLHLGGRRGDLDGLRDLLGADRWRQALDVCVRAAACFPGSLMAGVDLLIGLDGRLAVAEVNAFGDLLPGLTGLAGSGAEGLDTYSAQVGAALRLAARQSEGRASCGDAGPAA